MLPFLVRALALMVLLSVSKYREVNGQKNQDGNVVNIAMFGDTWLIPEFALFKNSSDVNNDPKSNIYQGARVGTANSDGDNWIDFITKKFGKGWKVNSISFATPNAAIVDGLVDKNNLLAKSHKIDGLSPLSSQIELYNIHPSKQLDLSKTVAIISVGTNDIIYRTDTFSKAPKQWTQYYIYYTSRELCSNIESLILGGTKYVLVMGPGPLGMYPEVNDENIAIDSSAADTISYIFNMRGKKCVEKLMNFYKGNVKNDNHAEFDSITANKNPKVAYLSIYDFLESVSKDHENMGITHISEPCITNIQDAGTPTNSAQNVCSDPQKYVFWDKMHLTSVVQEALSEKIFKIIMGMFSESKAPFGSTKEAHEDDPLKKLISNQAPSGSNSKKYKSGAKSKSSKYSTKMSHNLSKDDEALDTANSPHMSQVKILDHVQKVPSKHEPPKYSPPYPLIYPDPKPQPHATNHPAPELKPGLSQSGSEMAPQAIPGGAPQTAPGQVPQPSPGQVPQPSPGQVPQPSPGQVPQPPSGQMPPPSPGQTPQPLPGQESQPVSESNTHPPNPEAIAKGESSEYNNDVSYNTSNDKKVSNDADSLHVPRVETLDYTQKIPPKHERPKYPPSRPLPYPGPRPPPYVVHHPGPKPGSGHGPKPGFGHGPKPGFGHGPKPWLAQVAPEMLPQTASEQTLQLVAPEQTPQPLAPEQTPQPVAPEQTPQPLAPGQTPQSIYGQASQPIPGEIPEPAEEYNSHPGLNTMDSVSDYGYDTNTANPAATPSGGELNANSGNSLYPYVDYSEAVEGAIIIDEGEESTIKAAVVAPLVSTNATSGTPLAEASAHLDVAAPPTLAPPQFESLSQATPPSDYSVY